ncbi:MAG: glycosyltransferase family 4 protein [Bacteroidales bacterium]|jgi:glycosyltransferase involved in cell wall biosynthesis|nr:glycosyltransferase family 4 protein [Bacteroidales bacterium]
MKIINIVPGFGGTFYCGNCLRDSAFTNSLKKTGHDAITLPLYLPLNSMNSSSENDLPVFYGAVNVYLEQKFRFFRHMPKWLHKFFNSPAILRYASKKSESTRASGLEEMTISMLKGAEGYQEEELELLINFLKYHEKPDVVHLSNALLMGLAGRIREELNIPVICSLQDEDVWIDAMNDNYRTKLWDIMCEKSKDIDAFVAVSQYFGDVMQKRMCIPNEKLHIVPIGVDPKVYRFSEPVQNPPVIGYLSRMNKENGFEVLIDAFIELKKKDKFKNVLLKATGGKTSDDNKFLNKQLKKLKRNGIEKDIEFIDNFSIEKLNDFFEKLTVLSVPVLKGEAFGMYQLESLACGIPIVQPALGAFPEIAKETNGGVIYEPNTPDILAEKLTEVLSDREKIKELGSNGRKAVENKYNTDELTRQMLIIYEKVISSINVLAN